MYAAFLVCVRDPGLCSEMEEMCEGPDVGSFADIHAFMSALLFLTGFFQQFSPVLIFLSKSLKVPWVKRQARKLEYFTVASIDLSGVVAAGL